MNAETVSDWVRLLDQLYPQHHAQDWDSPGLQVGDPTSCVSGVLVTLDVTEAVILEAAERDCDLIVAHHPLLFRPLPSLTPSQAPGRLALLAAQLGIAIFAAHTNFDARPDTTSYTALSLLGMTNLEPLDVQDEERALGLIGTMEQPVAIRDIFARIRDELPSPRARLASVTPDATVTTVACCGGSGASLIPKAIELGAQLMITGDVGHHDAIDALAMGISVIDAGHYATESPAMGLVIEHLNAQAPQIGLQASIHASSICTDPWMNTPITPAV